jgi:hypothetical protein
MTRAQRALACAIGFAPVTAAGIVLMRCHCAFAARALEVVTAAAYLAWILFPRALSVVLLRLGVTRPTSFQ